MIMADISYIPIDSGSLTISRTMYQVIVRTIADRIHIPSILMNAFTNETLINIASSFLRSLSYSLASFSSWSNALTVLNWVTIETAFSVAAVPAFSYFSYTWLAHLSPSQSSIASPIGKAMNINVCFHP